MCRSFSSSACDRIAQRYIVGSTDWSMRIRQPFASSRSNRSAIAIRPSMHRGELGGEVGQHALGELRPGLDRGAVQHPGLARLDPRQPLGRDRRGAAATGRRPSRSCPRRRSRSGPGRRGCAAGRWAARTRHRRRRRRTARRIDGTMISTWLVTTRRAVTSISSPAERADPAVAEVLAHRQVGHPAGRQQVLPHHRVEVGAHLGAAGQLVVAGVEAARGRWCRCRAPASSRRSTPTADATGRTGRPWSSGRRAGRCDPPRRPWRRSR